MKLIAHKTKTMASAFKTEEDVIKDSIKNNKPTVERDLVITKTFLKQQSAGGDNVYDHLKSILSKVLDERPQNVMDYFEEFSRVVRMEKNRNSNSLLADTYVEPDSLKCAKTHLRCFFVSFDKCLIEQCIMVLVSRHSFTVHKKKSKNRLGLMTLCIFNSFGRWQAMVVPKVTCSHCLVVSHFYTANP